MRCHSMADMDDSITIEMSYARVMLSDWQRLKTAVHAQMRRYKVSPQGNHASSGNPMPLHFHAKPYSSFDPISGISIPRPRIGATVLGNGRHGTEYQFSIYHGEERVGGVGFEGWDDVVEIKGHPAQCFFFDLWHVHVINNLLRYRLVLGVTDGDFTFLQGLAQGFVLSYAGHIDNDGPLRYVALTGREALGESGVLIPDNVVKQASGAIVLASIDIPAHADRGHMP